MPLRRRGSTHEPHASWRRELVARKSDVTRLQGFEWRSKYVCAVLLIAPQLYLSIVVPRFHDARLQFLVWYALGCTLTQSLFLAIHELSHDLFFREPEYNRYFACIANLPIGIPFAAAFRCYHRRHHHSQGHVGVDGDVPTEWECRLLERHWSFRLLWLSLQIVAYAVRPLLTTDAIPVSRDLAVNWMSQLLFDALWVRWFGWGSFVYLLTCVLGAGSLHPCAGHFVSEHYGWGDTFPQETFSYYGPLNWLTWNVGYHNEHHDFPRVPWSRLPKVNRMFPEHYATLASHTSWSSCLIRFVTDAFSYRVVRG